MIDAFQVRCRYPESFGLILLNLIQYVNELLIFIILKYTKPFYGIQIYLKKKPESFFDPGFLLEFICYNFLYHIPVLVVFGSLLYVKPRITSPHNESDQILLALLAVLSC